MKKKFDLDQLFKVTWTSKVSDHFDIFSVIRDLMGLGCSDFIQIFTDCHQPVWAHAQKIWARNSEK